MQRIASEPIGGRMAQGRDTARHILGLGQAANTQKPSMSAMAIFRQLLDFGSIVGL